MREEEKQREGRHGGCGVRREEGEAIASFPTRKLPRIWSLCEKIQAPQPGHRPCTWGGRGGGSSCRAHTPRLQPRWPAPNRAQEQRLQVLALGASSSGKSPALPCPRKLPGTLGTITSSGRLPRVPEAVRPFPPLGDPGPCTPSLALFQDSSLPSPGLDGAPAGRLPLVHFVLGT